MKWFNNPVSLEQLKKEYKALAMKNHPDVGGSLEQIRDLYGSETIKAEPQLKLQIV